MNPEDFTNPARTDHPEVADNPEAMQPASEVTKQKLLDVVTDKSEGGYVFDSGLGVSRTLVFTEVERGTIGVSGFKDGASDDPSCVARIRCNEWPGKVYGEPLITNYSIVTSPDGLQLAKYSNTTDTELSDNPNLEDALTRSLEHIIAAEQSQGVENKMGLSFVSEAEAKDLLALIVEAQPKPITRY